MILNINGIRINRTEIARYEKIYTGDKKPMVKLSFIYHSPNSMSIMNIDCYGSEYVADSILSLIDDAFDHECNLVYINSEHIKGNIERQKDF